MRKLFGCDRLYYIEKKTVTLNDFEELKRVFGWRSGPEIIDDPSVFQYVSSEDANQRKLRDAEAIGTVVKNLKPKNCLEIGTGLGVSTAFIALNAPESRIYTVNIPPEDFARAGKFATGKLSREEIGSYYREHGLGNITQIFANTAAWKPDIPLVDFIYIDGCHDMNFVVNDTIKALQILKPGGFILWHDFHPSLRGKYSWINSVCRGVDILFKRGIFKGELFHIRDSWVGIHRISD